MKKAAKRRKKEKNLKKLLRLGKHYYQLYTQQFQQELEKEYTPFESVMASAD